MATLGPGRHNKHRDQLSPHKFQRQRQTVLLTASKVLAACQSSRIEPETLKLRSASWSSLAYPIASPGDPPRTREFNDYIWTANVITLNLRGTTNPRQIASVKGYDGFRKEFLYSAHATILSIFIFPIMWDLVISKPKFDRGKASERDAVRSSKLYKIMTIFKCSHTREHSCCFIGKQ